MDGDRLRRRDVLRGIGGTGVAGVLGALGASGTTAARSAAARTGSNGSEVFLGGQYIELGIRADGGLGTDGAAPESFYGSERSATAGAIGLYADYDGFDTGSERYEYFVPDEQFLVGYVPPTDGDVAPDPVYGVNGVIDGYPVETMATEAGPTETLSGTRMTSRVTNTFDGFGEVGGVLEIEQTYTLDAGNRYYRTDVTIENVGEQAVDRVRYARTTNPTLRTDADCLAEPSLPPLDGDGTLVEAAASACSPGRSLPPLYYYATDVQTREFVDTIPPVGLYPEDDPTGEPEDEPTEGPLPGDDPIGEPLPEENVGEITASEDGDSPTVEASEEVLEAYMGLVFEAGTLEPGETASVTYYTVLSQDIDSTIQEIQGPDDDDTDGGAEFSLVCDEEGCPEEATDGNERVTLSNEAPDPGEEIDLSVMVTNVGDESGAYFGELTDGFDSYGAQRVELDPDETATLTYSVTFDEPGTYRMFLTGDHIVDIPVGLPFGAFGR